MRGEGGGKKRESRRVRESGEKERRRVGRGRGRGKRKTTKSSLTSQH